MASNHLYYHRPGFAERVERKQIKSGARIGSLCVATNALGWLIIDDAKGGRSVAGPFTTREEARTAMREMAAPPAAKPAREAWEVEWDSYANMGGACMDSYRGW